VFGALEDPARLYAGALNFSYLGYLIAPKSLGAQYLGQIRSGMTVVSLIWFLYLYKKNLFARVVSGKALEKSDRERYLTMDRLSSIGLLMLGSMAFAESCGVAVQSVLTVGGIGGVAAAFAARDLLGNLLSGLGIQFSRPFAEGDYITAGDLSGQVVEIGLHSTEMLNRDKFPTIVPNSFFSSQVIVNRSRVRSRGLDLNVPVKLTSLEKLPAITSEIRSMLHTHPKVSMEDENPRCHVSQVSATSFNVSIACNLKPMNTDDFLVAEEEVLLEACRIVVRSGAALGTSA
jgi:MscS family membrane protein